MSPVSNEGGAHCSRSSGMEMEICVEKPSDSGRSTKSAASGASTNRSPSSAWTLHATRRRRLTMDELRMSRVEKHTGPRRAARSRRRRARAEVAAQCRARAQRRHSRPRDRTRRGTCAHREHNSRMRQTLYRRRAYDNRNRKEFYINRAALRVTQIDDKFMRTMMAHAPGDGVRGERERFLSDEALNARRQTQESSLASLV